MDFNEAKIRHEELVRIIEKYSYEYYVLYCLAGFTDMIDGILCFGQSFSK